MEKVHSAYRKDRYAGPKDNCALPLSAGPGEKTQPWCLERERTRSYSHRFHQEHLLLGRRKMFFTVKVGEPQDKLSGEPADLNQWRSSDPVWMSPENPDHQLKPALPPRVHGWVDLTRSLPILSIPGFKASADIRRHLQKKEKINLVIEEPASLYLLLNMNSIQRPWITFSCKN